MYFFLYLDDNTCEEYILWLKNNDKPWYKVNQFWEKTSKIRLKSLQSGTESIQAYIQLYFALEGPQGYTLVRKIFNIIYTLFLFCFLFT